MSGAAEEAGTGALDGALEALCGGGGRYQRRLLALVLAPVLFNAMFNAQYVFAAADVEYRCLVLECESAEVGGAHWATGAWSSWALVAGSRCERRAPLHAAAGNDTGACASDAFAEHTQRCDRWLYQSHHTIVAEFDLACEEWKRALVGTVHSLGVFTALIFVGAVSDRFGRKATLATTAWAGAAAGVGRSFAPSYRAYLALEFLEATLGAGVYSTGFVLAMETAGASMRVKGACLMSAVYALGQALLAVVAMNVPYWRTLTALIYAPAFLFLSYYLLLDESARWLIVKGRNEEAVEVLKKIAKINGRVLSQETEEKILKASLESDTDRKQLERSMFYSLLCSRVLMCRLCVCVLVWCAITFVYYGLSLGAVWLAGNQYVNYAATALAELPGYAAGALLLERCGRRRPLVGALAACGLALLLMPLLPDSMERSRLALSLVGKALVSGAFSAAYVTTAELFPTGARQRALGLCCLVSRLAMAAATLSPLMFQGAPLARYVLFGALSLAAAGALLALPDTRGARLPDTLAQAEGLHSPGPPPRPHRRPPSGPV